MFKAEHGGRPPVITDDMLHTVLRRRANRRVRGADPARPDHLHRQAQGSEPLHRRHLPGDHAKREAYPEAVDQAHADFAALQVGELPRQLILTERHSDYHIWWVVPGSSRHRRMRAPTDSWSRPSTADEAEEQCARDPRRPRTAAWTGRLAAGCRHAPVLLSPGRGHGTHHGQDGGDADSAGDEQVVVRQDRREPVARPFDPGLV